MNSLDIQNQPFAINLGHKKTRLITVILKSITWLQFDNIQKATLFAPIVVSREN